MGTINIRPVQEKDIVRVTDIYNWYILNTVITFELTPVSPLDMGQRVREKLEKYDWFVGECDQEVVGYAYYGSFRSRLAYQYTVESSIYLAQEHLGQGFGKALYRQLIASAQTRGFREMIGVIALPNPESIALHQRLGFEDVGVLKRVGYKFGTYVDTGIWQKSLP